MIKFHLLFLLILIGTELFFTYLDVSNIQYAENKIDAEAEWLKEKFGIDDTGRLKNYMRLKTGFSRLKSFVGLGFLLVFLYSGLLQTFVDVFASVPMNSLYQGILFFITIALGLLVLSWPFSLFQNFVVEEIFDFNESTLSIWFMDQLKSLVLTIVFTAVITGVLLYFVGYFPGTWWLLGWGFFVGFGLLMQVVYPRVIAPMFNTFEPVEEGDLREAIDEVFDRAGFTCSEIFTMDASKRSGHSNAYFIGFGRTKRVVLFDTLVEQLDLSQIQGVLAHELAHWKKGHVWKGIVRSAIRTGIMIGLLYVLVESSWLYEMFALDPSLKYAGFVLGGLWISPVSQWLSPLVNRWSIRDEREADEFAVEVMDDGEPLIEALQGLVSENLGNPFPHPLYASFHYSHPPIPDRIRYIRELSPGRSKRNQDSVRPHRQPAE